MITRKQARERGLHIYTAGRLCLAKHTPAGRYTQSGSCVACTIQHSRQQNTVPAHRAKRKARQRARYARDPSVRARLAKQHRSWKKKNPDALRRNWRKARSLPEATRPVPALCENCCRFSAHSLNLDHDHTTGKFRGWLCRRCNTALGLLGDSIEALEKALAYLKRAQ